MVRSKATAEPLDGIAAWKLAPAGSAVDRPKATAKPLDGIAV